MTKSDLIYALSEIATLLELKGENSFRIRAYTSAVRAIDTYEGCFAELLADISENAVRGVGKGVAALIAEAQQSGSFSLLEELRAEFPETILSLLSISGLGAKKLAVLYHERGISSLEELEAACKDGSLSDLKGFGKKTIEKFLAQIELLKEYAKFCRRPEAVAAAEATSEVLKSLKSCKAVSTVGSLRRGMEVVRNVNLLVESSSSSEISEVLNSAADYSDVKLVSDTLISALYQSSVPVLIHIAEPNKSSALQLSGGTAHLAEIESIAAKQDASITEQGLVSAAGAVTSDDREIYSQLELDYVQPELRDEYSLQEAAELSKNQLVSLGDIRGVLHAHSTYSDGKNSIREMAEAAAAASYQYLGITDHSQSASYAGGLFPDDIKRQHEEIDKLNEDLDPFVVFKGIESDILVDGALDYSDLILEQFDFIIASVHSRFSLSRDEQTARMIRAVENPYTTILGHPTGRLLLKREPYEVDVETVIAAAAAANTCIEINANPRRLDLDWRWHQHAVKRGIKLPICPDAHRIEGMDDIAHGVAVARKGGLQPKNILNCLNVDEISAYFKEQVPK